MAHSASLLTLILALAALGLGAAGLFARWVLALDAGTEPMQSVANAVEEGARAFQRRQRRAILTTAWITAAVLFVGYALLAPSGPATSLTAAFWAATSFLVAVGCSLGGVYAGLRVSIRANLRTAAAARVSLALALRAGVRGGAAAGLFAAGANVLGLAGLFGLARLAAPSVALEKIPLLLAAYGLGASLVALFSQLGGGIFTKAADVGADLVGKVETGIPEDDPRNPAVIADLVGDLVGGCAGRGADLFESAAAGSVAAMILGGTLAAAAARAGVPFAAGGAGVVLYALVAQAAGLLGCGAGALTLAARDDLDPLKALETGYCAAAGVAAVALVGAARWLLAVPAAPFAWVRFALCALVGVGLSFALLLITRYYTQTGFRPVKIIAEASQTGTATNLMAGLGLSLEGTAAPLTALGVALLVSYFLGRGALPEAAGVDGGFFGTALAAVGMLAVAAYALAVDAFGPISDNARGIAEMSQQPLYLREKTDRLGAAASATKPLTRSYALGCAALTAFALFSAYRAEVRAYAASLRAVDLARPEVFVAALAGAALAFFFAALAIRAVGSAAYYVIGDVRAQLREKPQILEGTERPDYGRTVDIVTQGALHRMVAPAAVAVAAPVFTGVVFHLFGVAAEALAALLMVGALTGVLLAAAFGQGGSAWTNAKKHIETGAYGGKRSDAHRAAVVGDTVGDPLKDTAAPALHVLVKLLSTLSLVLGPLLL